VTLRHAVLAVAAAAALLAGAAGAGVQDDVYSVQNLVADAAGGAAATDASLVNGWGLVAGPTTPWWTSNNGTNTSTLYSGTGSKVALTVSVPGGPTGTVFNGVATDFVVSQNGKSGAARFIFATEGGQILGWSPAVNGTTALTGADLSSTGAVFKGLATSADRLYATDFHNGKVDVFDKAFAPVSLAANAFTDPKLPKGYAPFGIQAIADNVYVTYAKQDAQKHDDAAGPGNGYVDEYTTDGAFVARVESGGRTNSPPNSPWGLAMAPTAFGVFSGDLLIGNFGNGRIAAYQNRNGTWVYKGELRHGDGSLVTIDGLWGLEFGNGSAAGPATTLYFTAGPSDEAHGLFGSIGAG